MFTAGQSAFGTKPAVGNTFGTTTSTAPTLGFGQTPSLFGGTSAASAKPGLFGTTNTFGNSGFGTTPSFGTGTGMGTAAPGSLFGNTTIGTNSSTSFGASQPPAGTGSSQLPIHQYILTLSEISQSSDHPLFRKMLEPSGKNFLKIKMLSNIY